MMRGQRFSRRGFIGGAAAFAALGAKGAADVAPVDGVSGLWRLAGDDPNLNGWLIVRDGHSLLVDCPSLTAASKIAGAGLPTPELILHTHVQEEHCREHLELPTVPVRVAAGAVEVARRSDAYFSATKTVWPPDRAWDTLGEEAYGIAGCVTERPPSKPLNVQGTFKPGDVIAWRGERLAVIDLAASSKRAVGFHWLGRGIVFTGDLLYAGGRLVNFYDLERRYNGGELNWTRTALARVVALKPRLALGAMGPAITDPLRDAARLVAWAKDPAGRFVRRKDEKEAQVNYTPRRTFGRYREVAPDIYQNTNWGNVILFVDRASGAGLMVDPCNCVWTPWEESVASFREDLRLLEKEAGLKRVELCLVTHPHGDHVQDAFVLRETYGTRVLATPDVAELLANPTYPYPCLLRWYGFPYDTLKVDGLLKYGRREIWRDLEFRPVWTPGHCFAHSGFAIRWRGRRIFCSGDALQHGAGPIAPALPFCFNDNGVPAHSPAEAYRAIRAERPEIVICGHSRSFYDKDGSVLRDLEEAQAALERSLAAYVPDGDLWRATVPPGYDALRGKLVAIR